MNSIRTKIQQLSSELEQRLADYKNGYPNNYAMMAIKMMPVFVMLLSVLMDCHVYAVYRIDGQMEADTTVLLVLAQLLLVFGLFWFIRGLQKTKKVKSDALKLSITAAQDEYNEYPDVKEYLQKISGDLSVAEKKKTKMKTIFNIVFWGFFVIYGTAIYIFTTPWYKLQRTIGVNNYSRILKMPISEDYLTRAGSDGPFLSLIPYKTDISDSIKIASWQRDFNSFIDGEKIESWQHNFYLEYISNIEKNNDGVRLGVACPILTGCDSSETFRLLITDTIGNPVKNCPETIFKLHYEQIYVTCNLIFSKFFCTDSTSQERNHYGIIKTLKYLQENQENLRFKVELIE